MGNCSSNKRKKKNVDIIQHVDIIQLETFRQQQQEAQNFNSQLLLQSISNLSKIHLEQFVGQGVNGMVYNYELENKKLAIKCYKNMLKAQEEHEILEKIKKIKDCPSIIPYYGMKKLIIEINGQFPYEGYALFFEACQTDLKQFIDSGQQLEPSQVFEFISQISLALTYLQANDCFHRDLKPANILLNIKDDKLQFFLCDFGESAILQQEMQTTYETQSLRGTPFYWPPELYTI